MYTWDLHLYYYFFYSSQYLYYWQTQPVHLISPTLNSPDTLLPAVLVGNTPAACHVRLATTSRQLRSHTHLLINSQIVGTVYGHLLPDSLPPVYTHLFVIIGFRSSWTFAWICFGIIALIVDFDKDVPSTVPSSPSTPSTSAATDVSAHRTCPRCTRRMSILKYDKHSLCVACRDVHCSVEVRCSECRTWLTDFMLDYVKHKRSLVSKGKKSSSSSPSMPVTAVTTAPVVSLPDLPV